VKKRKQLAPVSAEKTANFHTKNRQKQARNHREKQPENRPKKPLNHHRQTDDRHPKRRHGHPPRQDLSFLDCRGKRNGYEGGSAAVFRAKIDKPKVTKNDLSFLSCFRRGICGTENTACQADTTADFWAKKSRGTCRKIFCPARLAKKFYRLPLDKSTRRRYPATRRFKAREAEKAVGKKRLHPIIHDFL